MIENWLKLIETIENDDRDWKWLKMIKNDWKWLKMIENDWKWLKMIEKDWKLIESDWKWLKKIENWQFIFKEFKQFAFTDGWKITSVTNLGTNVLWFTLTIKL